MSNKWNSRSTIITLSSLLIGVLFLTLAFFQNNKIINISEKLLMEDKEVPSVFSEIPRTYPLGEIAIGIFTVATTKVGGDRLIKAKAASREKDIS